VLARAEIS